MELESKLQDVIATLATQLITPDVQVNRKRVSDFRERVRAGVLPHYLTNDRAHGIDHVDAVSELGLKMWDNLCTDDFYEPESPAYFAMQFLIIASAYTHDMFCHDRKFHHERAFEFLMYNTPDYLIELMGDPLKLVAYACREHRSTWKHGYSSTLSCVIASADRGLLYLPDMATRAFLFGLEMHGYSMEGSVNHAFTHLHEKYGDSSKLKVPDFYLTVMKSDLAKLQSRLSWLARHCDMANPDNIAQEIVDEVWLFPEDNPIRIALFGEGGYSATCVDAPA